jgi:hypothetical protein
MSEIIVKRVKKELYDLFSTKIDMSDCIDEAPDQKKDHLISRSIAGYALIMEENITPDEAALCITDGGNDYGIDAIYIDSLSKRLILIQSKLRNDGKSSLDIGDMSAFCQGISRLVNSDYSNANAKILNKQSEIDAAVLGIGYKIEAIVIYTSNSPLAPDIKDIIEKTKNRMNEDGNDIFSYKTFLLNDIYTYMQSAAVGESIDCSLQVTNWGFCADQEVPRGYYGLLSAQELGEIWSTYGSKLLSKNIRFFKGSTEVNDGIKKTLKENPNDFVYFNNGIKIISDEITRGISGGDNRACGNFSLKNISIVNGAQTMGSIGEIYKEDKTLLDEVKVFAHIISLNNKPHEFGDAVTKLSNTQNKIEKKDFLSIADPFHEQLKKDFAMDHKGYRYKTGDANTIFSENCTVDEAVSALGCALDDVDVSTKVKSNVGSIFDDLTGGVYKRIFNPSVKTHYVWNCIQFQKKFDNIRNLYAAEHDKIERLVSIHGNCFLLHISFLHFKPELLSNHFKDEYIEITEDFEQKIKMWIEMIIPEIVAIKNSRYVDSYPANIFKNAGKCKQIKDDLVAKHLI